MPIFSTQRPSKLIVMFIMVILAGCAVIAGKQLDERWGQASIKQRQISPTALNSTPIEYHRDIQPILDQRCVVCHACYDAPCQLKLSSYEGLDRGSNKTQVYNGTRLLADEPSRLGIDAKSTFEWRQKGFYPVLNERIQTPQANLLGSTFYRMLALKADHPLPQRAILGEDFDFSPDRTQECSSIEAMAQYEADKPLWGMPYGLPGIESNHMRVLSRWLEAGSPVAPQAPLPENLRTRIADWEHFLNQPSMKAELVSRYLYEHLFLANLYFGDAEPADTRPSHFFKLVRSRTPSGTQVDEIASRRPYDHPGVDQFYYRLRPVTETIIDKTHMPYRLDKARMQRWQSLFYEPDYEVFDLPGYQPDRSANPFYTFRALPAKSRYQFMLDEAQFTIMGYIKGPVCRGQVALNVIEDQFWVFFVDPDVEQMLYTSSLREDTIEHLALPAGDQSNALPTEIWTKYASLQSSHLNDRLAYIKQHYPEGSQVSLNALWDGGTEANPNAALTVFRHFDSATVVKGMKGPKPKTAWIISYSLLERIHYLLVAGFDVYGNLGHQLNTRLYMDFLRMEGESNFLMLLPEQDAEQQLLYWYRGAEQQVSDYLEVLKQSGLKRDNLNYQTATPKQELFDKLTAYLGADIANRDKSDHHLSVLNSLAGKSLRWLPETTFIQVIDQQGLLHAYTLLVNRAHENVSSLFDEDSRLLPTEYSVSILPGLVGSYPNSFLALSVDQVPELARQIKALASEADYRAFRNRFAVRRSDPAFWQFSDWIHRWQAAEQPLWSGIFDFNRLEDR